MGQLVARRLLHADQAPNFQGRTGRQNAGNNAFRIRFLWQLIRNARGRSQRHSNRAPGNFRKQRGVLNNFPDLYLLPPEIGIEVLKNLDATDLCLAACVWSDLANDEMLWEGLCKTSWGYCTAYRTWKEEMKSFKKLYLLLDEGSLTFNAEPEWGIKYLLENSILDDSATEIALFFHRTNLLCWQKVRLYLKSRSDVLDELIKLQSYKNQFLPNALRKFFQAVDSPTSRGEYLNLLIDKFAQRFCSDNPQLALTPEIVAILSYSLILLSVDLTSPQVKNKMSKREFVRNVCSALGEYNRNGNPNAGIIHQAEHFGLNARRPPTDELARQRAIATVDKDFAGHLYDNIYLVGHVAPQRWEDTV